MVESLRPRGTRASIRQWSLGPSNGPPRYRQFCDSYPTFGTSEYSCRAVGCVVKKTTATLRALDPALFHCLTDDFVERTLPIVRGPGDAHSLHEVGQLPLLLQEVLWEAEAAESDSGIRTGLAELLDRGQCAPEGRKVLEHVLPAAVDTVDAE